MKLPRTYEDIADLYTRMDQTFDRVARQYGFECNGCDDNCCKSLFFHHTHVEKAYLLYGFQRLDPAVKDLLLKRACDWCKKTFLERNKIETQKIMCPANENGKCLLYRYRPMICRLHGLPHELCRPGATPVRGPGCHAGEFDDTSYIPFDRTPFYRDMADIEMTFRFNTKASGKIKETVAQMLLSSTGTN